MSYEEVERMDGTGMIVNANGSMVGRRRYHLVVYQEMLDGGPGHPKLPGLRDIRGRITVEGVEGVSLQGADLTLQLEDGRSLPFFITDTAGTISARGALK